MKPEALKKTNIILQHIQSMQLTFLEIYLFFKNFSKGDKNIKTNVMLTLSSLKLQ